MKQHYSTTLTNTIFVSGNDDAVDIGSIRGIIIYDSSIADINSVADSDDNTYHSNNNNSYRRRMMMIC